MQIVLGFFLKIWHIKMPGHTENTLKLFWSLGRRNSELHNHKQKSRKRINLKSIHDDFSINDSLYRRRRIQNGSCWRGICGIMGTKDLVWDDLEKIIFSKLGFIVKCFAEKNFTTEEGWFWACLRKISWN